MGNTQQFKAIEDDCIYFYDDNLHSYRKVCIVNSFNELPASIKHQIRAAKEEAAEILLLPTE